jgi:hypothetical protein
MKLHGQLKRRKRHRIFLQTVTMKLHGQLKGRKGHRIFLQTVTMKLHGQLKGRKSSIITGPIRIHGPVHPLTDEACIKHL